MPYHNTSGKHIYANADRSRTFDVAPGEQPPAEAAVLLVAAGDAVSDEFAEEHGLTGALDTEAAKPPTLLERERAGLESAMKRRAFEEAKARRATIADLEAREEATKARRPAADKAVKAPAENKGS
jgi:hypothetical protein